MTKQEALEFINGLDQDIDGRIMFISHEIMDDGRTNTRTVNSTKEMSIKRFTESFDDAMHGSFRDGALTTVLSLEIGFVTKI